METKVLEIIKDESEKADVRKYTCVNGFGYSQFERNIAERVVKLFAIPDVINLACPNCGELEDIRLHIKNKEATCGTCHSIWQTCL